MKLLNLISFELNSVLFGAFFFVFFSHKFSLSLSLFSQICYLPYLAWLPKGGKSEELEV
jgi:hypothetical protein